MSVKAESLEMKKMMVCDSYLQARGRNSTTSSLFPINGSSFFVLSELCLYTSFSNNVMDIVYVCSSQTRLSYNSNTP